MDILLHEVKIFNECRKYVVTWINIRITDQICFILGGQMLINIVYFSWEIYLAEICDQTISIVYHIKPEI